MIEASVGGYIEDATRLSQIMDSLDVVIDNLIWEADNSDELQYHCDTVKELKDKIMDLSPLVDKILEDIEDL